MTKNAKILISITVLALLAVAYVIINTEQISLKSVSDTANTAVNKTRAPSVETPVDPVVMEKNYINKVKSLISSFDRVVAPLTASSSTDSLSDQTVIASSTKDKDRDKLSEKISSLKIELLEQKVPAKYKDLHLDLVLAFTKMVSFLSTDNQADMDDSLALINKDKEKYSWIKADVLGVEEKAVN